MTTLLLELRTATRDVHDRLEEHLDVLGWCREPAGYARLLTGMHSVYAPLEQAVSACPATAAAVPDWASRVKTPWLAADLAALGVAAPQPAAPPPLTTAEDVVGSAYVMEGATLGAAIILRELDAARSPLPRRFFTGYAARRGAMWQAFRRHVAALDARGPDRARVVEAARSVFCAVEDACVPVPR